MHASASHSRMGVAPDLHEMNRRVVNPAAQEELCGSEERSRRALVAMQDLAMQNTQVSAASAEREAELLERLQLSATLTASAQQQLDDEKVP